MKQVVSSIAPLVLALVAAFCLPYVIAAASPDVTVSSGVPITVCPEGPPTCDYATIQDGIDAAGAGETVLVHAGIYSENLVLRSGVALRSSDDPPSTTITALQGPVISGTSVLSGLVEGFTIRGQSPVSPAIGIEVLDSDLTISDCIIEGFEAEECLPVYGVRVERGSLVITGTIVRGLRGGDGEHAIEPDWCRCLGGDAAGVHSSDTAVEVYNSRFEDLWGGVPCWYFFAYPSYRYAGDAMAVRVMGGRASLRGNVFTRLTVSDEGDAGAYAVYTSNTAETRLESNTIMRTASYDPDSPSLNAPTIPGPRPQGPRAVGIRSVGDAVLYAANTTIVDWSGSGREGYATAVEAEDTGQVTLVGNRLIDLHGGYESTSRGIWILRACKTIT